MPNEEIVKQIARIIKEELQLGQDTEINKDTVLIEIGVESIALMSLLVYIEEQFEIEIDDNTLLNYSFKSINDVSEYVASKMK